MASKIEKALNGDIVITIPAAEVMNLNPDFLIQANPAAFADLGPGWGQSSHIEDVGGSNKAAFADLGPGWGQRAGIKDKLNFDKIKK